LKLAVDVSARGFAQRNVVIVLTDGADNLSNISAEKVVEVARRANLSFYFISMNGIGFRHPDADRDDELLRMLARETGGTAFFPSKLSKLSGEFAKIAKELRSRYTLAYRSSNSLRDGSFRTVRIEVDRRPVVIRARHGYYAPAN
jgi:Ca-activated chloride channel homolog